MVEGFSGEWFEKVPLELVIGNYCRIEFVFLFFYLFYFYLF